jgi:hypothetical protein
LDFVGFEWITALKALGVAVLVVVGLFMPGHLVRVKRARAVITGAGHTQFLVISVDNKTGQVVDNPVSVKFPPHNKKRVIRAIQAWGELRQIPVIEIKVSDKNGKTIFITY